MPVLGTAHFVLVLAAAGTDRFVTVVGKIGERLTVHEAKAFQVRTVSAAAEAADEAHEVVGPVLCRPLEANRARILQAARALVALFPVGPLAVRATILCLVAARALLARRAWRAHLGHAGASRDGLAVPADVRAAADQHIRHRLPGVGVLLETRHELPNVHALGVDRCDRHVYGIVCALPQRGRSDLALVPVGAARSYDVDEN